MEAGCAARFDVRATDRKCRIATPIAVGAADRKGCGTATDVVDARDRKVRIIAEWDAAALWKGSVRRKTGVVNTATAIDACTYRTAVLPRHAAAVRAVSAEFVTDATDLQE
jgi:hypothetical protein